MRSTTPALNGTASGLKGKLVDWNDSKGFGWIESDGKRLFAHIKEFDRSGGRRPAAGDEVGFEKGADPQGRDCAKRIRYLSMSRGNRKGMSLMAWIGLGLLLVLPGLGSLFVPFEPWYLTAWGAVASLFTAGMYFHDKKMAELGGWRTPESVLHLGEFVGGWPGAFMAQRVMRHKISKSSYQVAFWMIVAVHQIVALDLFLEGRLRNTVIAWIMEGR